MTTFDEIIDKALVVINDYKLGNLYRGDYENFEKIMDGYVVKGLPLFKNCVKSLNYTLDYDNDIREFDSELDIYEIDILAELTAKTWYESHLQNVLDFREPLRDNDFNKYSTGQNLKPREEHLNNLITRIKQSITDYDLTHISNLPYFSDYKS